uniref:Uncharacterized protein n=1 Tax=Rhizophora mucronata TaxID=61149 RepID=A0A2P2QBK9_RHIMU
MFLILMIRIISATVQHCMGRLWWHHISIYILSSQVIIATPLASYLGTLQCLIKCRDK